MNTSPPFRQLWAEGWRAFKQFKFADGLEGGIEVVTNEEEPAKYDGLSVDQKTTQMPNERETAGSCKLSAAQGDDSG
jgi:hypothetical protein